MSSSEKRGWVSQLTIERKLPLLQGALLLLVTVALASASYFAMRREVRRVASERLGMLTGQVRDLFATSVKQGLTRVRAAAAKDALEAFLANPDSAHRAAAAAAMDYHGTQPGEILAIQLKDSTGATILNTGPAAFVLEAAMMSGRLAHPAMPDSVTAGAFERLGDTLAYYVTARSPRGTTPLYVVEWHRLIANPKTPQTMALLIGPDATMLLGNEDGGLWTDLMGAPRSRPVTSRNASPAREYAAPEAAGHLFGAAALIPGTHWLTLIEVPISLVMQPANRLLRVVALAALVCLILALAAGWLSGHGITSSLRDLTLAAEQISSGNDKARVRVTRSDEIGRLSLSFNAMAGEVAEARLRLEDRVAERTRELHETMEHLRDAQEALVRRDKLALLSRLAVGVGYELRAPWVRMGTALEELDGVLPGADIGVQDRLEMLRKQLIVSDKSISDLEDFGRARPAERVDADLRTVACAQLERFGVPDRIAVECDLKGALPVHADPAQVGRIVMNMIVNAVQAMAEHDGRLTLRGSPDGPGRVRLEVSDTGHGIPPEFHEKVFEPLYTTRPRGIGLGLTVARALAEANGGQLLITGSGAGGTTFTLRLPLRGA